jgi:hypothetical protein
MHCIQVFNLFLHGLERLVGPIAQNILKQKLKQWEASEYSEMLSSHMHKSFLQINFVLNEALLS